MPSRTQIRTKERRRRRPLRILILIERVCWQGDVDSMLLFKAISGPSEGKRLMKRPDIIRMIVVTSTNSGKFQ